MDTADDPAETRENGKLIEALIARVAQGEEDALAALYDTTVCSVLALIRKVLVDPAEAEEATLDVYLQVWRRAGDFSPDRGSAAAWLLTIARTRAIDRLRTRLARRRREAPIDEGLDLPSAEPDPFDVTAAAEQRRIVARAVGSLPREQRRAISLAYYGGLTHLEIAERLGEPLGTVKTRIRLGMTKLRVALSPVGERHDG